MPPYTNPVNDFYFRNAQAQITPQQFQQPQYQFPPQVQQKPSVHCSFVSSIDEARAARSDDFLSTNIFLDSGTGKIYLKKIDNNGKPMFLTYTVEEPVTEQKADQLSEINARLCNIESVLGSMRNDKSIPSNAGVQQSEPATQSAVAEQNEPDGASESAGIPKNAGNDFWKKRK